MEIKAKGQTGGLGGNFLLKSEKFVINKEASFGDRDARRRRRDAETERRAAATPPKLNIRQEKTTDYRASTLACSLLLTKSDD